MIGIFDSGLGGLTVLKEIRKVLPKYNYLYLGDTLHVPYGNRSDQAVYELTRKACDFLFNNGCNLIILACNTATAKALRQLQQHYLPKRKNKNENILGVIRPLAEYAGNFAKEAVGVIGTRGTVHSHSYKKEIHAQNRKLKVIEIATPLLVPLIEENWAKEKETVEILKKYLNYFDKKNIDTLILGCTHYPILLPKIKNILGKNINIPNPGIIVAKSLADYLSRHNEIEKYLQKRGRVQYFVTDKNENFVQVAQQFLQKKINIKEVKY